eukprot:8402550-Karenia_brevis.AAC.1
MMVMITMMIMMMMMMTTMMLVYLGRLHFVFGMCAQIWNRCSWAQSFRDWLDGRTLPDLWKPEKNWNGQDPPPPPSSVRLSVRPSV